MYDPIVDEVRRVREELINRYGGLHGYIKHLKAMDRARARKAKQRSMKKPTVYLDTTIISAYWFEGADVASLARRLKTREWWDIERLHFSLWSSGLPAILELRSFGQSGRSGTARRDLPQAGVACSAVGDARVDSQGKPRRNNSETKTMMEDPIVDMVDRASEELIKRCGGVEGWIKHLQALDRARVRKRKAHRSPASGRAPAKN